jgi:competence protein ComEC
MTIHFNNVDQGDATYIKTPNGDDILIDAGNKGKGDAVVAYLKKQK